MKQQASSWNLCGDDRSERGRRSLRLASNNNTRWAPLRLDTSQLNVSSVSGGKASGASIIGVDLESGIAVEDSFVGGVRRDLVRSLCQVVNELDFPLQISVLAPHLVCAQSAVVNDIQLIHRLGNPNVVSLFIMQTNTHYVKVSYFTLRGCHWSPEK